MFQYCNDLMDAVMTAEQIWKQSKELEYVPIIDRNPKRDVNCYGTT